MAAITKTKFFNKYLPAILGLILIAAAGSAYAFFWHSQPSPEGRPLGKVSGASTAVPRGAPSGDSGDTVSITSDQANYVGDSQITSYLTFKNNASASDPRSNPRDISGTEQFQAQFYFPTAIAASVSKLEMQTASGWQAVALLPGSVARPASGASRHPVSNTDYQVRGLFKLSLAAGQSQVFRATITFPEGSHGEFMVEAIGNQGGYGFLDPAFTSSYFSFRGKGTASNPAFKFRGGGGSGGPVAFDASMTGGNGESGHSQQASSVTSISSTGMTVGASATCLVATLVLNNYSGNAIGTSMAMAWNGTPMTEEANAIQSVSGDDWLAYIFVLPNPVAGNKTLSASWDSQATSDAYMSAISFKGTDTTTCVKASDNTTSVNTTSITIPSDASGATVAASIKDSGDPTMNQTPFWADSPFNPGGGGSYAIGGTSNIHTFTYSGGTTQVNVGVHVIAGGGGKIKFH